MTRQRSLEIEKPNLFLAIDRSTSIGYAGMEEEFSNIIDEIQEDEEIRDRFSIQTFGFGKDMAKLNLDSLTFNQQQTDISNALNRIDKLNGDSGAALVLVTDGNQTIGQDYQYFKAKDNLKLFPVLMGDTSTQMDLSISNLNVNKYAFLNNRFPVETILQYTGNGEVSSKFTIRSGNSVLFSQVVNFSAEDNSEVITATLPAGKIGVNVFQVEIEPHPSEKNITNNSRKFGVEVIDERTSVLILSSIAHPDLGMLKKAIESNEQREATIVYIQDLSEINLSDFQLVVLYQPIRSFNTVFKSITDLNLNSWIITGTRTDWDFLNSVQKNFIKNPSSQTQEVFPLSNPNFSLFQMGDLGFRDFPPLLDMFGTLEIKNGSINSLLFQQLEKVDTQISLLGLIQENNIRQGFLFGENIWKWRTQSFLERGSFEQFDNLIGQIVQFLVGNQKKERLTIDVEPVYAENEPVILQAQFFDRNYQFDPEADLQIRLENENSGENIQAAMLLNNNSYIFEAEQIPPGDYTFRIAEEKSKISKAGSFTVLDYNIEQQFTSANDEKLLALAENNSGNLFYQDQVQQLKEQLLSRQDLIPVQKSREKDLPLIHWKFLLILLILSLAAEWFLRKYFGLI